MINPVPRSAALPSFYVGLAAYLLAFVVPYLLVAETKGLVLLDLVFALYLAALWLRPGWHLWLTGGFIALVWLAPVMPGVARLLWSGNGVLFQVIPQVHVVGVVLLGALAIVALQRRP